MRRAGSAIRLGPSWNDDAGPMLASVTLRTTAANERPRPGRGSRRRGRFAPPASLRDVIRRSVVRSMTRAAEPHGRGLHASAWRVAVALCVSVVSAGCGATTSASPPPSTTAQAAVADAPPSASIGGPSARTEGAGAVGVVELEAAQHAYESLLRRAHDPSLTASGATAVVEEMSELGASARVVLDLCQEVVSSHADDASSVRAMALTLEGDALDVTASLLDTVPSRVALASVPAAPRSAMVPSHPLASAPFFCAAVDRYQRALSLDVDAARARQQLDQYGRVFVDACARLPASDPWSPRRTSRWRSTRRPPRDR